LVAAFGVEGQVAEDFASGGVQDGGVQVADEGGDGQAFADGVELPVVGDV